MTNNGYSNRTERVEREKKVGDKLVKLTKKEKVESVVE